MKFDLEGEGQSPPKTIEIFNKVFCTSAPNLMVLAWTNGELWCGQAQNLGYIWTFKFNLTLKVKVDCSTIQLWDLNRGLLHLWPKFGYPRLNRSGVIARTNKWLTHRLTDTQTQATTILEGQNWPPVKIRTVYHILNLTLRRDYL